MNELVIFSFYIYYKFNVFGVPLEQKKSERNKRFRFLKFKNVNVNEFNFQFNL